MTGNLGTPKRKRRLESDSDSPSAEAFLPQKRSRIDHFRRFTADFVVESFHKFEENIFKGIGTVKRYFQRPLPLNHQRTNTEREAGHASGSVVTSAASSSTPEMFAPKTYSQRKQHYEENFTNQYVPHQSAMAPAARGRGSNDSDRQCRTSSFFGRPRGQQDISFRETKKKPITTMQYRPPSQSRGPFNTEQTKRKLDQSQFSTGGRTIYDKFYSQGSTPRPYSLKGKSVYTAIQMEEKAEYKKLLDQQRVGPGVAVPLHESYITPFKDTTNRSNLFGERTRPKNISPKSRPWKNRELDSSPAVQHSLLFRKPDVPKVVETIEPVPEVSKLPSPVQDVPLKEADDVVVELSSDDEDATKEIQSRKKIKEAVMAVSPLHERIEACKYASPKWIEEFTSDLEDKKKDEERQAHKYELEAKIYEERREEQYKNRLSDMIKNSLRLSERIPPQFLDEIEVEPEEPQLAVLTEEMENEINDSLRPYPQNGVLSEGFRMSIKRLDMVTLGGLNWLNDEIINFYLSMLVKRGELDNYPSCHTFNTFFYPKLMQQGHAGLKRWTKKVDIFSFDFLIVPVHLGMHWCLAMIDFPNKEIKYYDSMGSNNNGCLKALKKYLEDESLDKKQQTYSTADWSLKNMKEIPQQMNGSDCGMFLCKYAEYVTRRAELSFTQEDMPYFRRRMVWEIVHQKLL